MPTTRNVYRMPRLLLFGGIGASIACAIFWLTVNRPPVHTDKPATAQAARPLLDIEVAPPLPDARLSMQFEALASPSLDSTGLARIEALRNLSGTYSSEEATLLLHTLLAPRMEGEAPGTHSVRFHETALAMRGQPEFLEDFVRALATTARNTDQELVVRDYALQHLRHGWNQAGPKLKTAIEATIRELADESSDLYPSAVLSLHLLGFDTSASHHTQVPAVRDDQITPEIHKLLSASSEHSTACKLTALRIIGERRLHGFRKETAAIALAQANEHALVRMAAIATMARFGDPDDLALLQTIERSDPRISTALDHAITRLSATQ